MDENDRLQMYEAQAIAIEKEQELEENLQLQETVAGINKRNEDIFFKCKKAESEKRTRKIAWNPEFGGVCSELDPYVSVIIFGGWCNNKLEMTDSIFLYDSNEKKWINSPLKLPSNLSSHGSVILNDEIYIFGGSNGPKSTYKLGENRKWIKLADMNMERFSFGSLVFDDEIWVFGGWAGVKTVEKYNPQTNSWTQMPEMNQTNAYFAVSIINGKFYVSGGFNGNRLDEIEVFDPKKNKWEFFCNIPFTLYTHTSTVDGTNLIIIGGDKSDGEASNEVWKIDVLDPKKEWKKMPNLQQKRYGHNAVKLEDGLMAIGGEINRKTGTDSVEIFDGQKWKEGPKLPEERSYFSSIPLTGKNEKKFLQLLY